MRIALVHHGLTRSGGMESYLIDLVRGFRAAGHLVDVYARHVDVALAQQLGCTAHRVRQAPLPRLLSNLAFARAVARLKLSARYDLALTLARTTGQHVAVNGGTHPGFLAAMGKRGGLKDRAEIRLERRCVQSTPTLIAHSRRMAEELRQYYQAEPTRLHVLYPPVDTARFRRINPEARKAARQRLGLSGGDFAFLFPSMDHRRKGLPVLLEAFKQLVLPQARLLVAGRGAGKTGDGRIQELGYVEDMPTLYAAVDCTVLPSRYEPFGLVIAESLQCGTPVITAADAGAAELMGPDDGIQLDPCAPETLLPALQAMLDGHFRPVADFARLHHLELSSHVAGILAAHAQTQRWAAAAALRR